ncbi:MAG TPA: hypothetical protein VH137_05190 [Gemmatimonadales bacterium]|jgi:hypothetical protein|nr:hypothetical protein [Gemmatimonadales bacterium]
MAPPGTGRRWRWAFGVLVFAAVAPLSLFGLPFAALLIAARPTTRREWLAAALAGGVSIALLVTPETGLRDAVTRAWIVLVSVAFGAWATVRPAGFWALAWRAGLYAAAGVAVLANVVGGPAVWTEVHWEATRAASSVVRRVVEVVPPLYPAFEPTVRLLAGGWPVGLVLETLAGLALAWWGHTLVARTPLGPPLSAPGAGRQPASRRDGRATPAAGVVLNP